MDSLVIILLMLVSLLLMLIPMLLMEIIFLRRENKELRQTVGYFNVDDDFDLKDKKEDDDNENISER